MSSLDSNLVSIPACSMLKRVWNNSVSIVNNIYMYIYGKVNMLYVAVVLEGAEHYECMYVLIACAGCTRSSNRRIS